MDLEEFNEWMNEEDYLIEDEVRTAPSHHDHCMYTVVMTNTCRQLPYLHIKSRHGIYIKTVRSISQRLQHQLYLNCSHVSFMKTVVMSTAFTCSNQSIDSNITQRQQSCQFLVMQITCKQQPCFYFKSVEIKSFCSFCSYLFA